VSEFREEAARARTADRTLLENLLYHPSREVLEALLENPRVGEKQLAILLSRRDLSRDLLARIAQNREWMKSYPLKLAVVKHPRTPRHLALPLLKFIYLFDLLSVAKTAGVPPDLRKLAEEAVLMQREGLALGQRISLARSGSPRIAGELLGDSDRRVIEAALANPAMTEYAVTRAILDREAGPHLTAAVLRGQHLSLARVMALLPELARPDLADLAEDPRVREEVRRYVAKLLQTRPARKGKNFRR
jgi:hypothetical protein